MTSLKVVLQINKFCFSASCTAGDIKRPSDNKRLIPICDVIFALKKITSTFLSCKGEQVDVFILLLGTKIMPQNGMRCLLSPAVKHFCKKILD